MGEILGIGVTHFPGLMMPDAYMSQFLTRTLKSDRVPAEMKDPARWPEPRGAATERFPNVLEFAHDIPTGVHKRGSARPRSQAARTAA